MEPLGLTDVAVDPLAAGSIGMIPDEKSAPKEKAPPAQSSEDFLRENLELPIATIGRIMKASLPDNTQIAKDVKPLFAKAAGIFILYLSSHANEICKGRKRSTISAQDVLAAVAEIEFQDFLPSLEKYLSAYRLNHLTKKRNRASNAGSVAKRQKVETTA